MNKTCSKCLVNKPSTSFYVRRTKCKNCHNALKPRYGNRKSGLQILSPEHQAYVLKHYGRLPMKTISTNIGKYPTFVFNLKKRGYIV